MTTAVDYDFTRTAEVLDLVAAERRSQEGRYGAVNDSHPNGTGPDVRWLAPFTGASAEQIQRELRMEYEEVEDATGVVTWARLVREEVAEAFLEDDPDRLAEELIQVAALCVSWVERLRS